MLGPYSTARLQANYGRVAVLATDCSINPHPNREPAAGRHIRPGGS